MTDNARSAPVALAFMNDGGLIPSYDNAIEFAGSEGRIATMPDLIDARTASGFGDPVWSNWFTTASAEYYGLSAAGIPLIVVAHGVGPMSDKAGILSTYAFQYKDKTRNREGGRIPMPVFCQLADGAMGDVDVVEVSAFLASGYDYPFSGRRPDELLSNPLWVARLGGRDRAEAYVAHHAAHAIAERSEHARQRGMDKEIDAGPIVCMDDADGAPYLVAEWRGMSRPPSYAPRTDLPDGAIGHLLSVGALFDVHQSGQPLPAVQCDLGPQNWSHIAKFVGIRGKGKVTSILPHLDRNQAIRNRPELLWVPNDGIPFSTDGFGPLIRLGDKWFTQYPKVGESMDTGSAMHEVTSFEAMGEPVTMTTDGMFFFRYGIKEATRLAPEGANAYHLAGDVSRSGDNSMSVQLQFSRVTVDRSARLMTDKEIHADVGLMASLAGVS